MIDQSKVNWKRRREITIGLMLLAPLGLLILFAPTYAPVCSGQWGDLGICRFGEKTWHENGVVLEVIARWLITQDWAKELSKAFVAGVVCLAIVMAVAGVIALLPPVKEGGQDD